MIEQPELDFALRVPSEEPSERRAQIVAALAGHGWITARSLHATLPGWGSLEAFQRTVRAVAEDSDGRIITGQRGYCLIEEATSHERYHAGRWLISQGRKMAGRGIHTIRRAKLIEEGVK